MERYFNSAAPADRTCSTGCTPEDRPHEVSTRSLR